MPLSYGEGVEQGRVTEASRKRTVAVLADHRAQPPAAFLIFGNEPQRVKRFARVLDRREQSVFAGDAGSTLTETSLVSPPPLP